jgi:hypothetical protein
MLTRLGESGADAFTIMRIAGHSSVMVRAPAPEAMERAFERLQKLNALKYEQAAAELKAETAGGGYVPKESPEVEIRRKWKSRQIVEFKKTGA